LDIGGGPMRNCLKTKGKDDAGRDVPAGVYWVRVSDGVSTRARKVVLIR